MVTKIIPLLFFLILPYSASSKDVDKNKLIKFIDQKILISSKSNECVKKSYTTRDLEDCIMDFFKETKSLNAQNKDGAAEFKKIIMSAGGN